MTTVSSASSGTAAVSAGSLSVRLSSAGAEGVAGTGVVVPGEAEGVDLDEGMVRLAAERHPDLRVHTGDMVDFELPRPFDVVLCLFGSILVGHGPDNIIS